MKTLTKFVIFSFSCLICYTAISQIIAVLQPGTDLSTLTTCFFSAFGGEVLVCAVMKMLKLKNSVSQSNYENTDDTISG